MATRTVASGAEHSPRTAGFGGEGPEAQARFVSGEVFAGRYRIVSLLGRGGMGEVYRAYDNTLDQPVALKFLPAEIAGNPKAVARFRNEVKIARQVSHPNVCRVYDLGEAGGSVFLSMEYVDGEDLGSLLRRIGRLPHDKALEVARRLCAGLAAAHEKGVLHRDLKPGNIMLDGRGQVLLTDFGLAGLAGEIAGAEVRNGTPAYMAPEQLEGREVSVRSDIYSLGLVLYEIFAGKRPFEADTLAGQVKAQKEHAPPSLTSLVRDMDPAVERVIIRCLEEDPARRPASALAVAAGLPGGDPLAAALAAGETPSPEMVAAAGVGEGLSPRSAIAIFAAVMVALGAVAVLSHRSSGIELIPEAQPPEVLTQRAREIVKQLGYGAEPGDEAFGYQWNSGYLNYVESRTKNAPDWPRIFPNRPVPLDFWYRQSPGALFGSSFHSDLLIPGVVDSSDPPPIESGMISAVLDANGRLLRFEAMPQETQKPGAAAAVDWSSVLRAAGLSPASLNTAAPERNWLEAFDERAAWTGTWPGTKTPLRAEAAALQGRVVAFRATGPWAQPERTASAGEPFWRQPVLLVFAVLALTVLTVPPILARANLARGRGDRRGAARLAAFIFAVQMLTWLFHSHISPDFGEFGLFLLAVCSSVFYAALFWTLYLALEPYVRRRWPHALRSWSSVLSGDWNEPIVGRDVLAGMATGLVWVLIGQLTDAAGEASAPGLAPVEILGGVHSTLGWALAVVTPAARMSLLFFLVLFLMRVVLRNSWLAGAGMTLLFSSLTFFRPGATWQSDVGAMALYAVAAVATMRLGLVALAVAVWVDSIFAALPLTPHVTAWYAGAPNLFVAAAVACAIWALSVAARGRWSLPRSWLD